MAATRKNPTYPAIAEDLTKELAVLNTALTARLESIEAKIEHQTELMEERMKPIRDHEERIRQLEEAIGALKVKYDLLTLGSVAASVSAVIKSFLGI